MMGFAGVRPHSCKLWLPLNCRIARVVEGGYQKRDSRSTSVSFFSIADEFVLGCLGVWTSPGALGVWEYFGVDNFGFCSLCFCHWRFVITVFRSLFLVLWSLDDLRCIHSSWTWGVGVFSCGRFGFSEIASIVEETLRTHLPLRLISVWQVLQEHHMLHWWQRCMNVDWHA